MLYIKCKKKKKKAHIFSISFKVHPHPYLGSCVALITKLDFNNNNNGTLCLHYIIEVSQQLIFQLRNPRLARRPRSLSLSSVQTAHTSKVIRSDQAGKAAMGLWPPLEVVRTTWQRT